MFSQNSKAARGKQIADDLTDIIRQIEELEPQTESVDLSTLKQLVELARTEANRVDTELDRH